MGLFDLRVFDSGVQIVGKLQNPAGSTISATGASNIEFVFLKSDGTILKKTGEAFGDSDGIVKVRFWTISGDMASIGDSKMQIQLNLPTSGFIGSTNEQKMSVFRKLGA